MKQMAPRKFERKQFIAQATLRPLAGGPPLKVDVVDIGEGGLALFTGRGLAPGQFVEVAFPLGEAAVQAGLAKREGRVVNHRVVPDGNFLGIAFVRPL